MLLWFAAVWQVRPWLGTGVPVCAICYKVGKGVSFLWLHKRSTDVEIIGSAFVCCATSYREQLWKMLICFHKILGKHGLPFLRAKAEGIDWVMRSSDGLHRMSTATYRRYVRVGKVTLGYPILLDVVKSSTNGFHPVSALEWLYWMT